MSHSTQHDVEPAAGAATTGVDPTDLATDAADAVDDGDTAPASGSAGVGEGVSGVVGEDSDSDSVDTDDSDSPGTDDSEDSEDDSDDDSEDADDDDVTDGNALLVQEGDIAADYLERLLDIVDYDGDIDLDVENDRAIVAIVGSDLDPLVGPRGETLDALQELTRLAVAQKTGNRSRLMLDISGHREQRRTQLREIAAQAAAKVLGSGQSERLSPMNPFERKVVHDAIAETAGVRSESEGEEPSRRVVVLPEAG